MLARSRLPEEPSMLAANIVNTLTLIQARVEVGWHLAQFRKCVFESDHSLPE